MYGLQKEGAPTAQIENNLNIQMDGLCEYMSPYWYKNSNDNN